MKQNQGRHSGSQGVEWEIRGSALNDFNLLPPLLSPCGSVSVCDTHGLVSPSVCLFPNIHLLGVIIMPATVMAEAPVQAGTPKQLNGAGEVDTEGRGWT